ncbi:MAG: DUF1552 domain-containing protein [Polyangiaceae bacterium]
MNRRSFLRGAAFGAAALGLPFTRLLDARAADPAFPKRLVVFFSPNGTIYDNWVPSGDETDFTFSEILQPLAPFRDKLLILDNLEMVSSNFGIGDGHQRGMVHMLTASELNPGTFQGGGDAGTAGWASGPSVDQVIAKHLGVESLDLAIQPGGKSNWSRMSYDGSDAPRDPYEDPYTVFDKLFGGLLKDPGETEKVRVLRQSVLDYVREDLNRLESRLPTSERAKLQAHLEAVRVLETKLDPAGQLGGFCAPVSPGGKIDHKANDNFPKMVELMTDQAVMALACNITQVVGIQCSKSVGGTQMKWLGVDSSHHALSHEDNGQPDIPPLIKINTWYAERFAYLLQKMSEIPEGDGTLLDNSVVMWCNELGSGNTHSRKKLPIVLAGGLGGHFKTGRFLRYADKTAHSKLLVSLMQGFGIDKDSIGTTQAGTGALDNLT